MTFPPGSKRKVAIITGGAGGQGLAEARRFVSEGLRLVADVAYEKIMEVALAPYATRKNALRGLGGSVALELNRHGGLCKTLFEEV